MTDAKLRQLLLAIHAGRIASEDDALGALGISTPTFWRWVREARARGVKIENGVTPWRVRNWGPLRKEKPKS